MVTKMLSKLEKNRWKQWGLQNKHKKYNKVPHRSFKAKECSNWNKNKNALEVFNSNMNEA